MGSGFRVSLGLGLRVQEIGNMVSGQYPHMETWDPLRKQCKGNIGPQPAQQRAT